MAVIRFNWVVINDLLIMPFENTDDQQGNKNGFCSYFWNITEVIIFAAYNKCAYYIWQIVGTLTYIAE